MEYKINNPKGELAISLLCVADSMAISRTTKDGTKAFHKQTYDNIHLRLCSTLVSEVELHKLKVCDRDGIEVAPEQLALDMHILTKYLNEPNWDEIKKQHPECRIDETDIYDFTGANLDLGESKPDLILSKLYCYQSTFQQLNEWGNGTHIFIANEKPFKEFVFDLEDINGNVIERDYYKGYVGLSSKNLDIETPVSKPLGRQIFQEDEILRVIDELGFTPSKIPPREYGKPGIKAKIRGKLRFSTTVFDKAWERLRAEGRIKEE